MNRMLNYVWYSFKIVCWLYFEKNGSRSFKYMRWSSGKIGDNKVNNECMRGDPVIFVSGSNDFKIIWNEKMHGKK